MGAIIKAETVDTATESEHLQATIPSCPSARSSKSSKARSKPCAKSISHHFSAESKTFAGSALKQSANQTSHKVIPLGTGRPHADFYPWDAITFRHATTKQSSPMSCNNVMAIDPEAITIAKQGGDFDLAGALNYGHALGAQSLVRFLSEHVEIAQNPPYKNWAVCLTCGATAALEIALRIFCNRGNTVLAEQYTYPGMLEIAKLHGLKVFGLDMDDDGLRPDYLAETLRTWDVSHGPRPTVLYTIPTGQNPTGVTQSAERRASVYRVAEQYDLLIIEDDPYYYLQVELDRPPVDAPADRDSYLASLPPSYLSLDRSGRVIRIDSTSKILAPGLRTAWVTAQSEIIDKFTAYHEVSTGAVSGVSQLMLYNLLKVVWGHAGFFAWLEDLSRRYRARRDILLKACESHLPQRVCSWKSPSHGMFLWIHLDLRMHPASLASGNQERTAEVPPSTIQCRQIEDRIVCTALEHGVQVTKGSMFETSNSLDDAVLHLRLTYAAAREADLAQGVEEIGRVVRKEFAC